MGTYCVTHGWNPSPAPFWVLVSLSGKQELEREICKGKDQL